MVNNCTICGKPAPYIVTDVDGWTLGYACDEHAADAAR